MKTKFFFGLLFVGFFVVSMNAYETGPVAISPGSDEGMAVIAQSCPTFSWTAVDWAEAYKVAVFEAIGTEVLNYEEMDAVSNPVLSKEIQGRASSWTPTSDERLIAGREYVWYVQSVDAYGQGIWSKGKMFKVDVGLRFDGVEDKMREKLMEQGLSEEIIEELIEDMKSGVNDVIAYGVDTKDSSDSSQSKIRIQDLEGEGESNTLFGLNAGDSTTGFNNSFFGRSAGHDNSSGGNNTFIGYRAGRDNTTGNHNTSLGFEAGVSNTSGVENVFLGAWAGKVNTASKNTFVGFRAGFSNSVGFHNTFLGNAAGHWNTTGNDNTFIGLYAGLSNTSGGANTFLGSAAGEKNTTGYSNLFMGYAAGHNNTTGYQNTFLGRNSGYNNTSGYWNTFIGLDAGLSNTTGVANVFLGYGSGHENTEGHANVFLGYGAGYFETSSNKLYIENSTSSSPLIWGDFSSDIVAINGQLGVGTQSPGYPMELKRTGTNASIIVDRTDGAMNYINATASYANFGSVRSQPLRLVVNGLWKLRLDSDGSLTMKNGATCTAGGEWQNASSRELKENIQGLTSEEAVEAFKGLAPVRFNYKADKEDESLGFIAEDVPDLVATKDRKGMSTMDVVAVLTKVLQEQQRTVDEQREMILRLEQRIALLEKR